MKKFLKRTTITLLVAAALMLVAGCDNKTKNNEIRIGSSYNTLKILREDSEYPDLGKKLEISMAKGETEGIQVIATPQNKVSSYTVSASELNGSDGNKIAKENIRIFVQKYLEVKAKSDKQTNMDYMPGFYPDLLLPFELAEEHNENYIEAGKNQGFTVEFSTTSETVPGTYTGTLTLTFDGVEEKVPITVNVWDIDVTQCYGKTSFSTFTGAMLMGEAEFTPERYTNYYETMLGEYKTCLTKLPGSYDPEQMAQSVVKYWDEPAFTGYAIPADYTISGKFNSGRFIDFLYELAQKSEPDKILIERGYVYNIDEPGPAMYNKIDDVRETVYWCEEEVLLRLESEGYFDKFDAEYKQDFQQAIRKIPLVIPVANTSVVNDIGPAVNTYCAVIDQLDSERYREVYKKAAEETADRGGSTWYYTCVQPLYPYPTHHIDDALIGSRIMRWMQKSYDLEGYLYWAVSSYGTLNDRGWQWADPYENPVRYNNGSNGTLGDGYLVYPGKKYNIDTFLPSIRLTTFRDGQEDLNMLYELENLLKKYGDFYGKTQGYFDSDAFVQNIYDSLFVGTRYEKDDAVFYQQRAALADIILGLKKDYKLVYKTENFGSGATVEMFLANGYSLKVDGKEIIPLGSSGQGNRYEYKCVLDKKTSVTAEILKDGQTVGTQVIFVGEKTQNLNLEDDLINVSDGSKKEFEAESGLKLTFVSKGETEIEKLSFNPALILPETLFGGNWRKIGDMKFTLANFEDYDIQIDVCLRSGVKKMVIKERVVIPANGEITLEVNNVGHNKFNVSGTVDVCLLLNNVDSNNELLPPRTVLLKNIMFSVVS